MRLVLNFEISIRSVFRDSVRITDWQVVMSMHAVSAAADVCLD